MPRFNSFKPRINGFRQYRPHGTGKVSSKEQLRARLLIGGGVAVASVFLAHLMMPLAVAACFGALAGVLTYNSVELH